MTIFMSWRRWKFVDTLKAASTLVNFQHSNYNNGDYLQAMTHIILEYNCTKSIWIAKVLIHSKIYAIGDAILLLSGMIQKKLMETDLKVIKELFKF